jgi:hypothetical protein
MSVLKKPYVFRASLCSSARLGGQAVATEAGKMWLERPRP